MPRKGSAVAAARAAESSREAVPFVEGISGATIVDVPVTEINLDDTTYQYRLTVRTRDLKNALTREGQVEPVDLRGSKPYQIVDGFRRVQAIRKLGWPTVKALVHRGLSDEQAHERAFVKNVVRQNLTPIEKANAIRLAKKRGLKHAAIAREFGISERQLFRYERMLEIPKLVQELLDADEISMAHAAVLTKFDGVDVVEWVAKAQDKKWSAEELRHELRKAVVKPPARKKREFIKCSRNEVRGYAWRITERSTQDELVRSVAALERALTVLRKLQSGRPRHPRRKPISA